MNITNKIWTYSSQFDKWSYMQSPPTKLDIKTYTSTTYSERYKLLSSHHTFSVFMKRSHLLQSLTRPHHNWAHSDSTETALTIRSLLDRPKKENSSLINLRTDLGFLPLLSQVKGKINLAKLTAYGNPHVYHNSFLVSTFSCEWEFCIHWSWSLKKDTLSQCGTNWK